jgi:tRNA threonylcarbamoyladenosine modification (KEOPS) complex  Pcc1 subunit
MPPLGQAVTLVAEANDVEKLKASVLRFIDLFAD